MKKLLFSFIFILVYSLSVFAQAPPIVENCTLDAVTTSCALKQETNLGLNYHRISWTLNGSNSGSTILLQYSDTSQTTGFSTLITGTSTSPSTSSITIGTHPFWKLTLSGFTATSVPSNVSVVHTAFYNNDPATANSDLSTLGGVALPTSCNSGPCIPVIVYDSNGHAVLYNDVVTVSPNPIPVGAATYKCLLNAGTAVTGTTSTVCGAAVASNYIYIQSCQMANDHASVGTMVLFQDGSGGTTIAKIPNPSSGSATNVSGNTINFIPVLKVTTLGNALYMANVTNSSSTYASCQGFSSPTSY